MIHYTCDRCQRVIQSGEELRFELSIVAEVRLDGCRPGENEDQLVDEIDEQLGEAINTANAGHFRAQRFDLCAECYQEYCRNPLGQEPALHVEFSEN